MQKSPKIAIIGLGYVGLPLAVAFAERYQVVGFDINAQRLQDLRNHQDKTLEVSDDALKRCIVPSESELANQQKGLWVTNATEDLKDSNIFIITVPTPTDKNNRPVLTPLIKASETVGQVLNPMIS